MADNNNNNNNYNDNVIGSEITDKSLETASNLNQKKPLVVGRRLAYLDMINLSKLFSQFNPSIAQYFSLKSQSCQHEGSCIDHIIQSTIHGFAVGYGASTILSILSLLFNLKQVIQNPLSLLKAIISLDNLKFAFFPISFNFILKLLTCVSKLIKTGDSRIINFAIGFIAGTISLSFRPQKKRKLLALFLLTRACDVIYQSLLNRQIIPKKSFDYVILFCIMTPICGYTYSFEPHAISAELNKFYLKFSNEHINDLHFRRCWSEKHNLQLKARGLPTINAWDQIPQDFQHKAAIMKMKD